MPSILVLDELSKDGMAVLERATGVTFEVRTGLKGDALREALNQFDGAICRSGVKITAESLEGNKKLRAIVRAGVGTDNIDKAAATRLGIVVMNTPAGNTLSTAELAIALMLGLSRKLAPAHASLISGKWERGKFMGSQLAGKTLGVVGLGRIGQAVATRAQALEMRVIGFDPFMSKERTEALGMLAASNVKAMLPEIDYLTVHTPLTDETRNLIGDAEIEIIKPGARLINCARGGIYNEAALVRGLESGKLGGVALDVFESEPCTDSPLFKLPNVLVTPHLGASTEEAQSNVAVEGIELLLDYLLRGSIKHAVNTASLDPKTLDALRGYLDLAYRLGRMLGQMAPSGPESCRIVYRGEIAKGDTRFLASAFSAGLLESAVDEVNIVNAELLLKERGIELAAETYGEHPAFNSVISAELRCGGANLRVAGTLFGNNMPRLVQIGSHRLEAYLDGVMMVFTHKDVPGIIGKVGTIFGGHKVNIAQMSVGRDSDEKDGRAIGVLNLDNAPPKEAIEEVLKHEGIHTAEVIELPPSGQLPPWLAV